MTAPSGARASMARYGAGIDAAVRDGGGHQRHLHRRRLKLALPERRLRQQRRRTTASAPLSWLGRDGQVERDLPPEAEAPGVLFQAVGAAADDRLPGVRRLHAVGQLQAVACQAPARSARRCRLHDQANASR